MTTRGTRAALYCRVSTVEQSTEMQKEALLSLAHQRGWTVVDIYADEGVSGAKDRRPELDRLMRDVHLGRVDVVAVWKFDRFARSTRHLVTALDDFRARNVDFVSAIDSIDTTSAIGRCVFAIIAAIAELDRDTILARTAAGRSAAMRRGVRFGRPRRPFNLREAQERRAGGESYRTIAAAMKLPVATVIDALKAADRKLGSEEPSKGPSGTEKA